MNLVFGHDRSVAAWVADRIPEMSAFPDSAVAIGVADGQTLIGGVVYSHYSGADISMHQAGEPGWLNRERLDVFFAYPFRQLGCRRVTGLVARKNKHARSIVERLGFKLEGKIRHGLPADDLMLYGMLRSECRWLRGE